VLTLENLRQTHSETHPAASHTFAVNRFSLNECNCDVTPIETIGDQLGGSDHFRFADDNSIALAKTRSGRLGLPVCSPAVTRASAHFWAKRERAS
jgi:hypothetical protein